MIRKFNYTNRIKIKRSDLFISIDRSDRIPRINADLRIEKYNLPIDGVIYIEAYHRTKFERFYFGTVGNFTIPENRNLNSFTIADLEDIRFRVKIVDERNAHGCILALAEGISPISEDKRNANRFSLLGVDLEDMGNRIWELDLEKPDTPWLKINSRLPDPYKLLRNNETFFCMVYPEIVRQILTHILVIIDDEYVLEDFNGEDCDSWELCWLLFGHKLSGKKWPHKNKEEEVRKWIETCVENFCRSQRIMQRMLGVLEEN